MGFFSSLFRRKSDKIIKSEGKDIHFSETKTKAIAQEIYELSEQEKEYFLMLSQVSKDFISSYSKTEKNIFDAENLDFVLTQWKEDTSENKASKNEVVQFLGYAFGADLISSFNCEWRKLKDIYGIDFMVIHKKYKIKSFPFSSVLKAIEQDRTNSFSDIKVILKSNFELAKDNGDYDIRD